MVAESFEDALIAAMLNPNIQSVLIRFSFPFRTTKKLRLLDEIHTILETDVDDIESLSGTERSLLLGSMLKKLRPELDLFLVTDAPVEDVVGHPSRDFRRLFYLLEDYREVHLSIIKRLQERYETPFFNALRRYSQKPTGMFHALPISHAATITKSHWIRDLRRVLWPQHFRSRNVRNHRRLGFAAAAQWFTARSPGIVGSSIRFQANLLCNQWHVDGQQDRHASVDSSGRYRADGS